MLSKGKRQDTKGLVFFRQLHKYYQYDMNVHTGEIQFNLQQARIDWNQATKEDRPFLGD